MELIDFNGLRFYKWKIGASVYLAWPELGARLMNWHLALADGSVRDVIYWPADPDYSNPNKIRGGNPILFPFVARTFHKSKEGSWMSPEGKVLPMPRHGFARDGKFEIEDISERGFIAKLIPSEAAKQAYPYNYNFKVQYHFFELAFQVDLILENLSDSMIPWCAGHHFYFKLPWHSGLSRKDYKLDIPAKKMFYHGADGELVSTKEGHMPTHFDDPSIVDRIHTKLKSNKIVFGPNGGEENISILVGGSPIPSAWNAVTTWTENAESGFYCVEPWMGPPNAPEHKNGLHFVEPCKTHKFTVEVNLY